VHAVCEAPILTPKGETKSRRILNAQKGRTLARGQKKIEMGRAEGGEEELACMRILPTTVVRRENRLLAEKSQRRKRSQPENIKPYSKKKYGMVVSLQKFALELAKAPSPAMTSCEAREGASVGNWKKRRAQGILYGGRTKKVGSRGGRYIRKGRGKPLRERLSSCDFGKHDWVGVQFP